MPKATGEVGKDFKKEEAKVEGAFSRQTRALGAAQEEGTFILFIMIS